MARENQGLQIALIIFVMLTIILGVTTFLFFRQYDEATIEAAKAREDANSSRTAYNNSEEFNRKLKEMLGFAETDKIDTIDEKYREDMETYASTFAEDNRYYRPVLQYLHDTIVELKQELEAEKTARVKVEADLVAREEVVKPQIDKAKAAAGQAGEELTEERSKFEKDRSDFIAKQNALAAKLEAARKEGEATLAKLQDTLNDTVKRFNIVKQLAEDRGEKLKSVQKETFEVADGEITWVNQRNGTVWINLGRADSLGRQTSFSVYAADTNDVTKSGKKASIEITQLLGDHVAEARIIEDRISDPILPGDKIHTPVWSPGTKTHFALTGVIDIDGDGKSDLEKVRSLIAINGGVVDAWMDDKDIHGKMTVDTRYLVKGSAPTKPEAINLQSKMIGDADKLGIKKIQLPELLVRMGWKNQTPVVRFGPGANPKDFRAVPRDGVNRVSGGNVSGLFKERRPPRSGSGGAY